MESTSPSIAGEQMSLDERGAVLREGMFFDLDDAPVEVQEFADQAMSRYLTVFGE